MRKLIIMIYLCFLFFSEVSYSQLLVSSDSTDLSIPESGNIIYGMEKVVNTYLFRGVANLNIETGIGELKIRQNYTGRAIKTSDISFWDDERLDIDYGIDVWENGSILLKQSGSYYNADLPRQKLNHIGHIRSSAGFRTKLTDSLFIESLIGFEKNDQRDTSGMGPATSFRAGINNYDWDSYLINSEAVGEYISLNDNREQSLMDIKAKVIREYDEQNRLFFEMGYKSFLYPEAISDVSQSSIKNRRENNFESRLNFNFGISEYLGGAINLFVGNKDITHYYNRYYEGFASTAANNNRKELNLRFSGEIFYRSEKLFQTLRMNYFTNDEKNSITKRHVIEDNKLAGLINQSKLLDNVSNTTQIQSYTMWEITRRDTLKSNIFLSMFRYDTPSEDVHDDRDELTGLLNMAYTHRFSNMLTATIAGEYQMIHYVYIKAAKSANNLWNRRIRLNPQINLFTKYFSINPGFYVSSDYYSYDFEDISPGIDSYSIRELGYTDSLYMKISGLISVEARMKLRYYEQGILFWDSFSESPQSKSYELFIRGLMFYSQDELIKIGCGLRYFELDQKNIGAYALISKGYNHFSYAPETLIRLTFPGGMRFDLNGWYEFQKTDKSIVIKEIPNLLLTVYLLI